MRKFAVVIPGFALVCAGCAFSFGSKQKNLSPAEAVFQRSDIYSHESRTLSGLATLENGVNDYIKDQGKIPEKLEDLVPQYLAQIPLVELGRPDLHGDT